MIFKTLSLAIQSYSFQKYRTVLRLNCVTFNTCKRNINILSCLLRKNSQFNKKTNNEDKVLKSQNLQALANNLGIWKNPINMEKVAQREEFNKYIKLLGTIRSDDLPVNIFSDVSLKHCDTILQCQNKIFELAVLLECSPEEAFEAILKHNFIFHSRIPTLKEKVHVITEGGISLKELRKDLWVLSYTIKKLEQRIEKVKALQLPIKCWMLRCKESTLNRTWESSEENKAAMAPFLNSHEYLCSRLEMNSNQLVAFLIRHPAVIKVRTPKLRKLLDYLLSEGFTRTQIYSKPRILCHSISTIKNRLADLRQRNCEPHTLSLLCMSEKTFQLYLEKLDQSTETESDK